MSTSKIEHVHLLGLLLVDPCFGLVFRPSFGNYDQYKNLSPSLCVDWANSKGFKTSQGLATLRVNFLARISRCLISSLTAALTSVGEASAYGAGDETPTLRGSNPFAAVRGAIPRADDVVVLFGVRILRAEHLDHRDSGWPDGTEYPSPEYLSATETWSLETWCFGVPIVLDRGTRPTNSQTPSGKTIQGMVDLVM